MEYATAMPAPPRRWLCLAIVSAVIASACGADSDNAASGIPEQDTRLVALGEGLYLEHCAICHGADLRGTNRGPSHLSVVYEPNHHGDVSFYLAVRNGAPQHHWRFGDMAPIEGLTDPEIEAMIAYIRENQRINGFDPYPPR